MVYDLDKRSLISDSQTKKKIREYNIEPLLDIYILDRNYYCDADEATLEQSYNFDGVYGPIPNDDGTVDLSYWASNYYLKDGNPSELPAESKAYLDEVLTTGKYKVVNMSCMFYTNDLKTSTKLASLDVSNWDTSNVTDMFGMFFNCNELTTLDVSNWDTSNVTNMNNMFSNCNSLTTLDVSNWDTSNVTDMSYMFYQCNDLVTLDVSNWDTSNVKNMSNMFYQLICMVCFGTVITLLLLMYLIGILVM